MAFVWPATLTQYVQKDTFSSTYQNGLKSQPSYGPPKFRRRSSVVYETMPVSWKFTTSQLNTFEDFYRDTLESGTQPFTMNSPLDGTSQTFNFDPTVGYTIRNIGPDNWEVSGTLIYLRV